MCTAIDRDRDQKTNDSKYQKNYKNNKLEYDHRLTTLYLLVGYNFVVWIMLTTKLSCSVLTRSTTEIENFKSIFPTVSCKEFFLYLFALILSLDLEKCLQKEMFQVTCNKLYTERENVMTIRKLDAIHFFSSLQ